MKQCIFCGEKDIDAIAEHHTIPRCINPNWKETIPVCQKCHTKIHKYLIGDLVEIVLALKEDYNQMEKTLNSNGIINNVGFPAGGLRIKLLDVLISNIPLVNGTKKKIYVSKLVGLCGLSYTPDRAFRLNYQKIGYALKKMGIKGRKKQDGRCVVFDRSTIYQLNKLQRNMIRSV